MEKWVITVVDTTGPTLLQTGYDVRELELSLELCRVRDEVVDMGSGGVCRDVGVLRSRKDKGM